MAATAVTLKVIYRLHASSNALRRSVQHFTRFQLTVYSHGLSALADLLVYLNKKLSYHSARCGCRSSRACERSGSGRISAHNYFCDSWSPLRSPLRDLPLPLQPMFFTPVHHCAPAHQIFGPPRFICAHAQICFKQQTEKWTTFTARAATRTLTRY